MASWSEIEAEAGEFAAAVRALFDAHLHKTLATVRADGAPRISGTEADFRDGELFIGSMLGARKAADLLRDPRFALHSATAESGADWKGDAKIAGRMVEVLDEAAKAAVREGGAPEGDFHLFRAEISEVSLVRLGEPADHLVIEAWHEGRGYTRTARH